MNPDLLPLLNLRRQAAAAGWVLAGRCRTAKETTLRFERDDDLDGGKAKIYSGWWNGPADNAPTRIVVNSPDGFIIAEHLGAEQAVRMLRAMFGWDADVDAVWPPRTAELVQVGGAL